MKSLWIFVKPLKDLKNSVEEEPLKEFLQEALFLKEFGATRDEYEEAIKVMVSRIFLQFSM